MLKVYAVIVTYKVDFVILNKIIKVLNPSCEKIVLINNDISPLIIDNNPKIIIQELHENMGLAYAQNVGMNLAFKEGADFVLQLDQDCMPSNDMVENLLIAYQNLIKNGRKVGLLGPGLNNANNNIKNKLNIHKVTEIASSGALIPKKTYLKIGGMMTELFIDRVDFEYCWRASKYGLETYIVDDAILKRHCGEYIFQKYGLIRMHVNSPLRRYYLFRNVFLLHKCSYVPIKWQIRGFFTNIARFFIDAIFLDKPRERNRYAMLGIFDALLGVTGKIPRKYLNEKK